MCLTCYLYVESTLLVSIRQSRYISLQVQKNQNKNCDNTNLKPKIVVDCGMGCSLCYITNN